MGARQALRKGVKANGARSAHSERKQYPFLLSGLEHQATQSLELCTTQLQTRLFLFDVYIIFCRCLRNCRDRVNWGSLLYLKTQCLNCHPTEVLKTMWTISSLNKTEENVTFRSYPGNKPCLNRNFSPYTVLNKNILCF